MPSLNVIFNGNARPLEKELNKIKSIGGSMGSWFAGLVGTVSIGSLIKDTISWADNLRNVADNLRVNVEWLQKMQNGAQLTGASLADVSKLISTINKSRGSAIQRPGGQADQAFQRFGFTADQVRNLNTQQFIDQLVGSFKNGASTQMANDLSLVGGKSARNLIAAFDAQFQSDMPVLAEDMIDALANLDDSFRGLKTTLMVDTAPAIVSVTQSLQGFLGWLKEVGAWLGAHSAGSSAMNDDAHHAAILRMARVAVWESNLNRPLTPREQGLVDQIMAGSRATIAAADKNTPGQAALDQSESNKRQQQAIADGEKAARELRRHLENGGPDFNLKPLNQKMKFLGGDLTENQKVGAYALPGASTLVDINRSMDRKLAGLLTGVTEISRKMDGDSDDEENY